MPAPVPTPVTYVALDLETTGLDPARDDIIEIALITWREGAIVEEFASLVNPESDIPSSISKITGITDAMVAGAPTFRELRTQIRKRLSDHVLIGHNVDFDLGFLRDSGLAHGNHRLDTLTIASIIAPEAGRFTLTSLADHFNVLPTGNGKPHRAQYDTELTIGLYLALRERALSLPIAAVEEIVEAGRKLGWPETLFFEDVLAAQAKAAFQGRRQRRSNRTDPLFTPPDLAGSYLEPGGDPAPLAIDELRAMIEPGGRFDEIFPGFEHRPQQTQMLQAVAGAFNDGRHLFVEAGTGTGKSLGYLLPAAQWALTNRRRVVISTNTINLQDQLISKDIPILREALGSELRATVRKGRSNYLCTHMFQQMRHAGPRNADEMTLFARILLWLPHSATGDVSEIVLRTPGERLAWSAINSQTPGCGGDHCSPETCPYQYAKTKSELSHLVVINHSLLFADIAMDEKVLPEFDDLILDEAHHLESAITDSLAFKADYSSLDTLLNEIRQPKAGVVAIIQQRIAAVVGKAVVGKAVVGKAVVGKAVVGKAVVNKVGTATLNALIESLRVDAALATLRTGEFFNTVDYFLQNENGEPSQFPVQTRLTQAIRIQPDFQQIEESWEEVNKLYGTIGKGLERLKKDFTDPSDSLNIEGMDELRAALAKIAGGLERSRIILDKMIMDPSAEIIYWGEQYKGSASLHAAPLHVGAIVDSLIFRRKRTVILTSATLRTAEPGRTESTFEHLRERLHAAEADELSVGSPFDYKNSTLLYLINDTPEPNEPGYQQALERAIIDTATTLGGRTLVLFTANKHLSQTAEAIDSALTARGITTLAQNQGLSRGQLLAQFSREGSRAVLLGTRSFWEGVDIPGPALTALIIAKLPFDVPSDPIFAARSETYENPFIDYSIPETVLRFRQGFGRLIRRQSDEGIVLVLDKRVLTKRYGAMFLEALPPCTVIRQPASRIGELIERWQARDRNRKR